MSAVDDKYAVLEVERRFLLPAVPGGATGGALARLGDGDLGRLLGD